MDNGYDEWAQEYAELVRRDVNDPHSPYGFVTSRALSVVGPVRGKRVLDAGCGPGHVSSVLAARGASVVAVDVSQRLIQMARLSRGDSQIEYECRDLTKGLAEYRNAFDIVLANLVLNDTPDCGAFIRTMGESTKSGGHAVVTLNNPYSAVIRQKVANYAESGASAAHIGLGKAGVHVKYYHRTMEELVEAFHWAGYVIERLEDLIPQPSSDLPVFGEKYSHFPYMMLLLLSKQECMASLVT